MKKLLLFCAMIPSLMFAQQEDRSEISSADVQKGLYAGFTINPKTSFDNTFNGKIAAGMHFNNFHIGAHYLTSFGETSENINRMNQNDVKLKYSGYGFDLMYEIEVDELVSVAPYVSMSFMEYEYINLETAFFAPIVAQDNFLNTQIGTKLLLTPNKNFKVGLDLGYSMASDVDLELTEDEDLSGMTIGISLQFNHFFPKY
ncbi:MAG: outer membrane beta-barrel protein [Flavobacteriales bacterium]